MFKTCHSIRLLGFLVFLSAAPFARAADDILDVPFIAQKPNYCGPAALAMLANYYGHPVSQDEIASGSAHCAHADRFGRPSGLPGPQG